MLLQLAAERKRNASPRVAVPWEREVTQDVGDRPEAWRRWQRRRKMNGAEVAQRGLAGKTANDSSKVENLVHPTAENKHVICDSSIHRIKHVSIKMNVFR
jgi:hypothetical protein